MVMFVIFLKLDESGYTISFQSINECVCNCKSSVEQESWVMCIRQEDYSAHINLFVHVHALTKQPLMGPDNKSITNVKPLKKELSFSFETGLKVEG